MTFKEQKKNQASTETLVKTKTANANVDKFKKFEKVDDFVLDTAEKAANAKRRAKHFFYLMSRPFVHIWQHSFLIQLIWHLTWLISAIYAGQVMVAEYETSIYNATSFLTGKNRGYIALHYTNMITYSYNVLAILSAVLIVVCVKCIHNSFRKVHPKKGQN